METKLDFQVPVPKMSMFGAAQSPAVDGASLAATAVPVPENTDPVRQSINGAWILDTTRGDSMRGYLSCMDCSEMAIEAMEKGEKEVPTIHILDLMQQDGGILTISKKSRVNNLIETYRLNMTKSTSIPTSKDGRQHKTKLTTVTTPPVDSPLDAAPLGGVAAPSFSSSSLRRSSRDGVPSSGYGSGFSCLNPRSVPPQFAFPFNAHSVLIHTSLPTAMGTAQVSDFRRLAEGGRALKQTLTILNENTGKGCRTERWFKPFEGGVADDMLDIGDEVLDDEDD